MATQTPAAYAAASNFRLFKDTSRQSNILQSYSKQDVSRLYNERQRLLNENRALNGGSISFQGSAFNAINHLKGMHAGRSHPIYQTNAMESYSFLASPNLHGRPSWNNGDGTSSSAGTLYKPPRNGKTGQFTQSFGSGMFEDTSIGSLIHKKLRKSKELEEKARKALEKQERYEEIIRLQEEKILKRRELRLRRKQHYIQQKKAAIVIQNHIRKAHASMRVKRIRHKVHTEAAMQIQILLRKRLTNKRIEKRVEHKKHTKAAKNIQKTWEKRMQRKRARMELEKRREAREKARRRLIRELEKKKRNEAARKIQNMVKVRQAKKFADLIRKKKRRNMRLKKKKGGRNIRRPPPRRRGGAISDGSKAGVV
eukprot:g12631.t1